MTTFIFTPLATDNFTPNANPLNPANWSQSTDGQGEFEPLQALNGTCVATSDDQIDFCEFYTGISSPNDQYVSITLNSIVNDATSGFTCFLRSSSDAANQYDIGIYSVDASHLRIVMSKFVDNAETDYATLDSFPYTNGDVFTFAAIGTTQYVLQNGVLLLQGTDATFASGLVGIDINPFTTPNATAVVLSNFKTGAASISGSGGPKTVDTIFPGSYYGPTLAAAFYNPTKLDLLQVVNEGNEVVWNLTYNGIATTNPSSFTPQALLGRFNGANFAAAFPNPYKLNIFQIKGPGNGVVFYVDYQGNAVN